MFLQEKGVQLEGNIWRHIHHPKISTRWLWAVVDVSRLLPTNSTAYSRDGTLVNNTECDWATHWPIVSNCLPRQWLLFFWNLICFWAIALRLRWQTYTRKVCLFILIYIHTCNNLKEYIQLIVLSYHENFISIINKRLLCQVIHFPSNCKVTWLFCLTVTFIWARHSFNLLRENPSKASFSCP